MRRPSPTLLPDRFLTEPELHLRNMELVRAHNQLNDRFGQLRQHLHHRDLQADTVRRSA